MLPLRISYACISQPLFAGETRLGYRRVTNIISSAISARSRSLSTWERAQRVWQRHGRQIPPEEQIRAKYRLVLRKQQQQLEKIVKQAVRSHLATKFENEFALRSSLKLVKSSSPSTVATSFEFTRGEQQQLQLSASGKILLALNGFEGVELPKSTDRLKLAEGVVAAPRSNELSHFLTFSQPTTEVDHSFRKNKTIPPIVQQGLTLYRVVEDQAASFVDAKYNAIAGFVQRRIRMPLESAVYKLTGGRLTLSSREAFQELSQQYQGGAEGDINSAHYRQSDDTKLNLQSTSNAQSSTPQSANGHSEENEPPETLLVLSRDEILLYKHMAPSIRIVALPHVLRHSTASTLVSVSLVVFGALPLAYRSYKFASDYPGLSQIIATSVVATISYGIWSQRVTARTSQSQVVTHALMHRLYARDDACVLVLQEGAIHHVTQAVLAAYYRQYRLQTAAGNRSGDEYNDDTGMDQIPPVPKSLPLNGDLVNPTELAIQFGLLKVERKDQGDDNEQTEYQAIALKEAILLKSST